MENRYYPLLLFLCCVLFLLIAGFIAETIFNIPIRQLLPRLEIAP